MTIGYHDRNSPSGLTLMIIDARERGVEIEEYDTLPTTADTPLPHIVIVNPPAPIKKDEYWENMAACISSHPTTRFLIFTPFQATCDGTREFLGQPENIFYLTLKERAMKRLQALLE